MTVEYRRFYNSDPPALVRLWHEAELGRGAAAGFDSDAFEESVLCQPYFDPHGLIVAEADERILGFAHSGFGSSDDGEELDHRVGVLCVVVVHPEYRRRGIGSELVRRSEEYLRSQGAETIHFGVAVPHDPFYVGLYGGSRPAGLLDSDPAAAPFAENLGYTAGEEHRIFQRNIARLTDPVSMRLVSIRRQTKLMFVDDEHESDWWWLTRYGRYELVRGVLASKSSEQEMAGVTLLDLHFYAVKWQHRSLGLLNLLVEEDLRRHGYGQALLIEICRRLRQEMITIVEIHAPAANVEACQTFESAGFTEVDRGTVYTKT